jgi:hypothetical protein
VKILRQSDEIDGINNLDTVLTLSFPQQGMISRQKPSGSGSDRAG